MQRATGLEHLNGDVFITPDAVFELGLNPDGTDANTNDFFDASTQTITYVDGTQGPASGAHLIIAGNNGHDYLKGGLGDDTIYGDAGNDFIQGSQGNDHLYGGDGDDTIHDDENDDFIRGGNGNDRIFAGGGALDTLFGDEGDDELHGGDGIDEVLGGEGDDMLFGEGDTDVLFGENGNDYLDGGDSVDEMWAAAGNDWLRGGVGDDHLVGGDGNDLLEGGLGPTANDGDRLVGQGTIDFGPPAPADLGLRRRLLRGCRHRHHRQPGHHQPERHGSADRHLCRRRRPRRLTVRRQPHRRGPGTISTNGINNLLVGGAGNDILTGLGGDDFIFGDSVVVKNDLSVHLGPVADWILNWKGTGEDRPDFGVNGGLGHVLGDNGADGTADKAVFSGARSDYSITMNPDGTLRVVDNRGIDSTAAGDTLKDVEFLQFLNGTFAVGSLVNIAATGAPVISDLTPTEGQALTLNTASISDANGTGAFSYQWQALVGATWTNIAGATGASFTPDDNALQSFGDQAGLQLRAVVSFTDLAGNPETVTSAPTGPVGVNWSTSLGATFNGTAGDDIANGSNSADTLNGNAGNDTLNGNGSADTLNGGAGNDALNGGAGTDTAVFAGAVGNYTVDTAGTNILVTDNVGSEGTDTLSGIEQIRFNGVNYAVVAGTAAANINLNGATGANNSQAVFGFAGIDTINGGAGNDLILGGAGNDTITQNRQRPAGVISWMAAARCDTYQLNGAAGAETFTIYSRAAALAAIAGLTSAVQTPRS